MDIKRIFTIYITVVFLSGSIAIADLNEGLVAYYPFNGNANDESGNENNGTVHGATLTAGRNGNANSAYSFDGVNDYIEIDRVANDLPNGVGTISIFFKEAISDNSGILIYNSNGDGNGGYIALGKWTGSFPNSSIGYYSNEPTTLHAAYENGTGYYSDEQWHHVSIVVGIDYNAIYVDGNQLPLDYSRGNANTGNIFLTKSQIRIGMRFPEHSVYRDTAYRGVVDDIRIYNRALSESEIQELYNTNSGTDICTSSDTNTNECIATYNADGTLNIPCVSVRNVFGGVTVYAADMAIIPLSSPLSFELIDAKIK